MRRNNNFRLLLLSGVLSSIFSGCGKENTEWLTFHEYIYKNSTSHRLDLTGYSNKIGLTGAVKTWSIAPMGVLAFEFKMPYRGGEPIPVYCDSVRLLFGGHKELWCRHADSQPWCIIRFGVEYEVRWNRTRYTHDITEAYYDRATEILLEN